MTRDARAIGAGLAPARAARAIERGTRLHVIGAAGAGASAAALLALHAGATVSGCDRGGPSPYTPALSAAGIPLAWAHDPAHVSTPPVPSRVAVTKALTAVDPDHPELLAARERGLVPETWQQVVADAAAGRRLVAVAGTHGKSTTAGWLVHVLVAAGHDPSAFVGALLPASVTHGEPATARWGEGPAFVVEADEYAGNFDPYRPDVAVLTGAEWDHPDVFADRSAVEAAFADWLSRAPRAATLVVNVADPGARGVLGRLGERRSSVVGYSLADDERTEGAAAIEGRILAADEAGTTLAIAGIDADDPQPVTVRLRTAGRHNAANALAVAGAAHVLGLSAEAIVTGLVSFEGVGRRLEWKGVTLAGVPVYDDYGHHPTAIRGTISAVRQREPGRRVWAVYEPLTYHRTAALLADFADALATADAVVVADIWAGRDPDTTVASARGLADAVHAIRPELIAVAPGSVGASADWLAHEVRPGDVVLVMGGGHSYRIGERLVEATAGGTESAR